MLKVIVSQRPPQQFANEWNSLSSGHMNCHQHAYLAISMEKSVSSVCKIRI